MDTAKQDLLRRLSATARCYSAVAALALLLLAGCSVEGSHRQRPPLRGDRSLLRQAFERDNDELKRRVLDHIAAADGIAAALGIEEPFIRRVPNHVHDTGEVVFVTVPDLGGPTSSTGQARGSRSCDLVLRFANRAFAEGMMKRLTSEVAATSIIETATVGDESFAFAAGPDKAGIVFRDANLVVDIGLSGYFDRLPTRLEELARLILQRLAEVCAGEETKAPTRVGDGTAIDGMWKVEHIPGLERLPSRIRAAFSPPSLQLVLHLDRGKARLEDLDARRQPSQDAAVFTVPAKGKLVLREADEPWQQTTVHNLNFDLTEPSLTIWARDPASPSARRTIAVLRRYGTQEDMNQELLRVLKARNADRAERCLGQGADPNVRDEFGTPVLTQAATIGDAPIVRSLLDHGAAVGLTDREGRTPLHLAVFGGHFEVVEALLDNGANIEAPANHGQTPLMWAVLSPSPSSPRVVRLLLDRGAGVNTADADGTTPLQIARTAGKHGLASLLVERGAETGTWP